MDFSARPATKDAGRYRRRRSCTPPRFSSTLPTGIGIGRQERRESGGVTLLYGSAVAVR